MGIFGNLATYSPDQEENLKSRLAKKLMKLKNKLTTQLREIDKSNSGFINFTQLRRLFEVLRIELPDDLLEYLIHLMKKFSHGENNSLEDLKYDVKISKIECGEPNK